MEDSQSQVKPKTGLDSSFRGVINLANINNVNVSSLIQRAKDWIWKLIKKILSIAVSRF